jgi:divalent metal cation (Fe/Co/Zn/Cd) transporter
MFSIYEGIHKYQHPEPVENIWWGVAILTVSLFLEGYATFSNVKSINQKKNKYSFINYITSTKESDLIVVFGENSAAVLGLSLALMALLASYFTGDGRYDALGSVAIGLVLIAVAIFLAKEIHSLLIGESADEEVRNNIKEIIEKHPETESLINVRTAQKGPGMVLVCAKIKCKPHLSAPEISKMINTVESELRTNNPSLKWIYIEPDLQEWKA